jgi:hypothetical protein
MTRSGPGIPARGKSHALDLASLAFRFLVAIDIEGFSQRYAAEQAKVQNKGALMPRTERSPGSLWRWQASPSRFCGSASCEVSRSVFAKTRSQAAVRSWVSAPLDLHARDMLAARIAPEVMAASTG